MAYEDDRDLDLDRSLYEEDPAYEADTYFGERLDDTTLRDSDMDAEEYEEEDTTTTDESFGESLQREDDEQQPDAPDSQHESEDPQDEGLVDKAKRKIDQMTSPDES